MENYFKNFDQQTIGNPFKSDDQRRYLYWKVGKKCDPKKGGNPKSKECKKYKKVVKEYEK